MVPGSTFRYGSNFIRLTFKPRLSSRHPIDAAASPLPKEDTTPPVTKMYFADIASSLYFGLVNCAAGVPCAPRLADSGRFAQKQKPTGVHGARNSWARCGGGWRAQSIMAEKCVEGNVEKGVRTLRSMFRAQMLLKGQE